ncbi:TatD family hydrolase [archaeon]|nr:TatD family hydrolase [archaeon]
MKLIDIGANLSNSQFNNDIDNTLKNASLHNVKQIILTTVNTDSFIKNLTICQSQQPVELYTTWGLHPHYSQHLDTFLLETLEKFQQNSKYIKAIGEFGLDFFRMISNKTSQEKSMHYFLNFSKNNNYPLFLHEREAHDIFCSIFKDHTIEQKSVIHCFTGNKIELKNYLDLNMYIGITGWICDDRRNQNLIEALNYIPIDKLMIETDSPYLKPRTIKSKSIRNEPAFLQIILEKISTIKNISIEELGETIYNNSIDFFNIKHLDKKPKL